MEIEKHFFLNVNEYHTPEETPRDFMDKLFGNSRWIFVKKYFSIIVKNRKIALDGRYNRSAWASSSFDILRLIENCGGRFHITGLKNIRDAEGPVVFVSNHMSTLETMVFPAIVAPVKEVTFVVKESLVKHFLFGPVMRARNPIVVGRKDSRADFNTVMKNGLEMLASGTSIIIFPQSKRSIEFIPKEFNSLGVKLAKSAGVQIIPIAIKTDFWGYGKYLKHIGPINRNKPIYMNFGKPISISGNGKEENKMIIEFISNNLENWK